ncbi:hypothetical protein VET2_46050 (plasmid) [Escherichia coli]|nr:hypothetical protein VET10_45820 [Escherichia coli]BEG42061.1 hypothetical protein VET2_46050 [Escherichia coli]
MSVTESKAKTERKSSRKPAKTQETVLSALLAQTEEVSVPLASLIKSPLNVRTVPYSAESVSELADSIKGVGLLQNLVVHALPGDRYGVAAGGRRLAALNMLAERDIIQVDWPVRVKVIPQELATAASMTENGHRRDMHPAEQIAGFRAMAQEGKTPAQIGDLLGYSPRHVQRMLKLADLAPVILDALAEDRITTEHCQALALENDTARQVQVFEAACQSGWGGNTLIPMGTKEDPFWQGSGRTIFAEAAYLMRNDPNRSYSKLVDTLLSIKIEKLRTFLRNSPAANLVEEKIEKTAISIRAVLTNYVKAIRYLQGIEHNGESFTIRDWMRGVREDQKNGWLFISSNADTHASLKPVISMWLSIAIRGLLAMGENRNRRVWFFCDELPTLLDHANRILHLDQTWMFLAGRGAFPLFALVWGLNLSRHAHIQQVAINRLWGWAVIAQFAYYLADFPWYEGNILFAFAVAAQVLTWCETRSGWRTAAAILLMALWGPLSGTSYGIAGLLMLAVSHRLYRAEDRAERLALVACLLAVIPALNLATSDAAAVAGLVMTVLTVGLVSCAGKSLPRFWPGDFFPTFYACHLAVLGVLAL